MQFALPPRKPSHNVPYTRLSHSSAARRRKLKTAAVLAVVAFSFLFFVSRLFSSLSSSLTASSGEAVPTNIVIVTVLDEEKFSDKYIQRIKQNREDYAKRHGKNDAKVPCGNNGLLINNLSKNKKATRTSSPVHENIFPT